PVAIGAEGELLVRRVAGLTRKNSLTLAGLQYPHLLCTTQDGVPPAGRKFVLHVVPRIGRVGPGHLFCRDVPAKDRFRSQEDHLSPIRRKPRIHQPLMMLVRETLLSAGRVPQTKPAPAVFRTGQSPAIGAEYQMIESASRLRFNLADELVGSGVV